MTAQAAAKPCGFCNGTGECSEGWPCDECGGNGIARVWACPECGMDHRGKHTRKTRKANCIASNASCGGFVCNCDNDEDGHGDTVATACHNAECGHCGWQGTWPPQPKETTTKKGAEDTADLEEDRRRLLAVQMAVRGEWSGLARQLALWGIKPIE